MRRSLISVLLCAFCALAAALGPDGVSARDGGGAVAAGYQSRAGAVLGTYCPAPPDRSPATMARAAARLLDSLSEAQRRLAQYGLASPEKAPVDQRPGPRGCRRNRAG